MRRIALLATSLLLSGCAGSGTYAYLGHTISLPGANPNRPSGSSETYLRVRAKTVEAPVPMLTQAGDVWPPTPVAPPSLKDLQSQQSHAGSYGALAPLPLLPGYEIAEPSPHAAPPPSSFPGGVVALPSGKSVGTTPGSSGALGNGNIVVPNGNGTSTVIAPNGAVSTIPTPGK